MEMALHTRPCRLPKGLCFLSLWQVESHWKMLAEGEVGPDLPFNSITIPTMLKLHWNRVKN